MIAAETTNAQDKISFQVSFTEPQAHYADVEMNISGIKKDFIDVKMPVWAPGSYLVREFAKNVEGFEASNGSGKAVAAEKVSKNTWRIRTGGANKIKVNYRVYAFEISVRTSFVDASHAFLSPTGIFMYVDGNIKQAATVKINPFKTWTKVSTGLQPVKGETNTFYAADFDILFDSPIEVGNQDTFEFKAAGVDHEVAMYGGGNYDKERLKKDMARIVEEETAIFGENPNKRYVFIVHNYNSGGGGLEHLNSTVLGASRYSYANENGYKSFLGLVAHEYFHLWNVKRLRPKALGPFNYDAENYTTDLWIAEGFTAYYDNLMLRRTDVYSMDKYLEVISNDINTVENQPGNRVQPVAQSSYDAWIKYYRPNENSRNSTISYYDKGSLLGMLLDLEIIQDSKGQKNLDDVMKAMYEEYYKKQKRGYTDAEFKAMAEKMAGKSLDKFYADYVYGTAKINYADFLSHAGLKLVNENEGKNEPFLGVNTVVKDGKVTITSVARGSAAWNDGLNANDEIIGIDGNRVSALADIEKFISSKQTGDKIVVTISRDALLKTIEVKLTANQLVKYKIQADENATPDQLAVREKWLKLQNEKA